MNCQYHPERPAAAYCRTCGRPLCADDQRVIYGVTYCQECLARQMGQASAPPPMVEAPIQPPPGPAPSTPHVSGAPSPGIALLLGFIPGVGAIYNGQYMKAVVQVAIFGFLVSMQRDDFGAAHIFGLATAAFYFYMVIDSYRTASAMTESRPVPAFLGITSSHNDAPTGAIVLIVIGCFMLANSLGILTYHIEHLLLPLFVILFGVYLLARQRPKH